MISHVLVRIRHTLRHISGVARTNALKINGGVKIGKIGNSVLLDVNDMQLLSLAFASCLRLRHSPSLLVRRIDASRHQCRSRKDQRNFPAAHTSPNLPLTGAS
jgi:hypothetical protein